MAIALNTSGKGKKQRPVPVVNVTPLVDVALVVLIILMTVTPMMMKQFWLNLPKKDDQQQKEPPPPQNDDDANKPLVLTIDRQGAVKINNTLVQREELKDRLPRMLAAKTQKVLYFDAHDELPYVKAAEVLDLARLGGAKSIAILTQNVVH